MSTKLAKLVIQKIGKILFYQKTKYWKSISCINILPIFINMQRKNETFARSEKIYHLFLLTVSFFVPLQYAKRKQTIIKKFVPAICKQIHFRGAVICYLDRSVR